MDYTKADGGPDLVRGCSQLTPELAPESALGLAVLAGDCAVATRWLGGSAGFDCACGVSGVPCCWQVEGGRGCSNRQGVLLSNQPRISLGSFSFPAEALSTVEMCGALEDCLS